MGLVYDSINMRVNYKLLVFQVLILVLSASAGVDENITGTIISYRNDLRNVVDNVGYHIEGIDGDDIENYDNINVEWTANWSTSATIVCYTPNISADNEHIEADEIGHVSTNQCLESGTIVPDRAVINFSVDFPFPPDNASVLIEYAINWNGDAKLESETTDTLANSDVNYPILPLIILILLPLKFKRR